MDPDHTFYFLQVIRDDRNDGAISKRDQDCSAGFLANESPASLRGPNDRKDWGGFGGDR